MSIVTIDSLIGRINNANNGSLYILAGAGISINSGLPSAISLLRKILKSLRLEDEDEEKLILPTGKLAMPFEMFFDTFLKHERNLVLLDLFGKGKENTFHNFLVKCFTTGRTSEIYTTNFDLLIEKAFNNHSEDITVFKDEKSFATIEKSNSPCKLIKIHGSYDDIKSIRTTLFSIANNNLSEQRSVAIKRLFSKQNDSPILLILGYSCSDVFDIIPIIESITNPKIEIILIEHTSDFTRKENCLISSITEPLYDNPFTLYNGYRAHCNTESFVEWVWEKLDTDYLLTEKVNDIWSEFIEEKISGLNVDYSKFTILGRLFWNISDYVTSLKYYLKALTESKAYDINLQGGAYTNVGLTYHGMRKYSDAIAYHEKAYELLKDTDFYYGISSSLVNLGYSYIYYPDFSKAIDYFELALNICEQHQFNEAEICKGGAYLNLGLVYEKQGQIEKALEYYFLTWEIDKEGDKLGEMNSLKDIARAYRLLGDKTNHEKYFSMAQKIGKYLNMPLTSDDSDTY